MVKNCVVIWYRLCFCLSGTIFIYTCMCVVHYGTLQSSILVFNVNHAWHCQGAVSPSSCCALPWCVSEVLTSPVVVPLTALQLPLLTWSQVRYSSSANYFIEFSLWNLHVSVSIYFLSSSQCILCSSSNNDTTSYSKSALDVQLQFVHGPVYCSVHLTKLAYWLACSLTIIGL